MSAQTLALPRYPVDIARLLAIAEASLDAAGVPCSPPSGMQPAIYHPTTIAQYALAHWNAYLTTGAETHRATFVAQANWLVAHERPIAAEAGGWPVPVRWPGCSASGSRLSASAQGKGLSVLVRAFRLTGDDAFLRAAHCAVRSFELDILDGGVHAPVGEDGLLCFEEVAVYPAAHMLCGFIFALFGLYDYATLTGDERIVALIRRALATLHLLLAEYDTSYWTRCNLLHEQLATPAHHALHVSLLAALAKLSGCAHCAAVATRWAGYQRRWRSHFRYFATSRSAHYCHALGRQLRPLLFGARREAEQIVPAPICVPITAFPVAGGMRSVLAGVEQVMAAEWQMEYLARHSGPGAERFVMRLFGSGSAAPWQFPNVWLYVFAGWHSLTALLRQSHHYRLILPQDGVFTGAFAALAAKMAGVRVVCMDHGTVTLPYSHAYRAERLQMLVSRPWPSRLLVRLRFACYWPSLRLLARIAAHYTDHFLAAGDDVAETYQRRLGVHPRRITCFPFMVDVDRYTRPDLATRARRRAQHGIAADAVVITMVNRLAPEKGLAIALAGISQALAALPPDLKARVRVIIAGDGPLRPQVETDIRRYALEATCMLWGEATPEDVVLLLGISDIFLYTGTRGINSMAILEAMAAGCAVIASMEPRLIAKYLANGRGIALPAGSAAAVSGALIETINDPARRQQMGERAREYVAVHHSAMALKRALLRATYWPARPPDVLIGSV
jgi:glycosyltransferase involved in cell wall biosynthesis